MALLQLRQVSFTYPGAQAPAVHQVSFSVEKGELVGICGATGSGKSTLLRLLKRELTPMGQREGTILLDGVPLEQLPPRTAAFSVGYVMQRPDEQIVTDKVWHELAFGLENMGLGQSDIARRVAETAAYFGIEGWYEKPVDQLSGGQKQLLNLAAVMAMQPSLLILDEPTAQLDPIAAADFIATVHRLNRELGLTVLVIEHRLEELMPLCDKLLALEAGRLLVCDAPARAAAALRSHPCLLAAMPAAVRLYHALGRAGECPLSIAQGRRFVEDRLREMAVPGRAEAAAGAAVGACGSGAALPAAGNGHVDHAAGTGHITPDAAGAAGDADHAAGHAAACAGVAPSAWAGCAPGTGETAAPRQLSEAAGRPGRSSRDGVGEPPALRLHQVYFRYERSGSDVLRGTDLTLRQGEILCLLGGNGSGKSTLLSLAAGLNRAQHGQVEVFGKRISAYRDQSLYRECVALLPQDVQTVFLCDTVREELQKAAVDIAALPFDLTHLMDRHPYDLSGGEQQLVALARVLALKPRLLLLDEPAKGLDAHARKQFAAVLKQLKAAGVALLIVTHDVAFAAQCADRCVLLFRGEAVSEGEACSFFSENLFYSTAISRMTRGLLPGAVTVEDAAALLGGEAAGVASQAAPGEDGAAGTAPQAAPGEDGAAGMAPQAAAGKDGAAGVAPQAAPGEDGAAGMAPQAAPGEDGAAGTAPQAAAGEDDAAGMAQKPAPAKEAAV